MGNEVTLDAVCRPSDDVVARDIEGQIIIIPLAAGIGDIEDAIFTLNETGRAIWDWLDGTRSLRSVAADLSAEYEVSRDDAERDVIGLVGELAQRRIVIVQPE